MNVCCATAPSSPKPPPRDWDGICPQGTTLCEPSKVSPPSTQPVPNDGLPRTCCPANQHCYEYRASVYCAPNDSSGCAPGETFCGPNPPPANYTGDSACCPAPLLCTSLAIPFCDTIYYCTHPSNGCASDTNLFPCGDNRCCKVGKEACYSIGGGKGMCGALCPLPGKDKSENPVDPEKCTPKCQAGETVCEGHPNGAKVSICCPKGSCSSSSEGAPLCIPIPTATPTPLPGPTIVVAPDKEPLETDNNPFNELDQRR